MYNRIKQIRKSENMTQQQFAEKIGLTRNYVAMIEIGQREPSDRTISDICREFGVDKVWLETGVGEPFRPMDRNEQIAAILGKATAGNATARDRLIRAFAQLPDEMYDQAEQILEEIVANLQKEKE